MDIERVCGWFCTWLMEGSEASLLSSPALKTLFGLLPLPAGEPAPPGPVDPGRLLSTSIEEMYLSSSSRFSARLGVGARIYKPSTPYRSNDGGTYITGATYTLPTARYLSSPKLSLPLQLCKLRLLCQDLISALLHHSCDACPSRGQMVVFWSSKCSQNLVAGSHAR